MKYYLLKAMFLLAYSASAQSVLNLLDTKPAQIESYSGKNEIKAIRSMYEDEKVNRDCTIRSSDQIIEWYMPKTGINEKIETVQQA